MKRDRYGRLRGGLPDDVGFGLVEAPQGVTDDDLRQWSMNDTNLSSIARMVYVNRNAQGIPAKLRAGIRAQMRPHLRVALRHGARLRAALLAGDERAAARHLAAANDALGSAESAIASAERAAARTGERYRGRQSQVASHLRPRTVDADHGHEPITAIVGRLVRDNPGETTKVLWGRLKGTLDEMGASPRAEEPGTDIRKWRMTYEGGTLVFSTFERHVTRARNPQ